MKETYLPHPDLLFQTRSGVTPAVLWGAPLCEAFFGSHVREWETPARKLIYALDQLATQKKTEGEMKEVSLSAQKIRRILDVALTPEMAEAGAFFVLAVARCLGTLVENKVITETEFSQWWEELESVTFDATVFSIEKQPLARILLAGELAETLMYVALRFFEETEKKSLPKPSVKRLETLKKQAEKVLAESLDELLDGAGCPRAEWLPIFRMLTAAWTRMRWLDRALLKNGKYTESIFDDNSRSAYEWAVRMLMYFTRADGSLSFSQKGNKSAFWCPELFVAALKMDSDQKDKMLGVTILPGMKTPENMEDISELPARSNYSPWGRSAVMQKNWLSRTGATITWNEAFPKVEIANRKTLIFSGDWAFSGSWNGRKLEPVGEWRSILWHSVEQGDYLELELELTEGFTLQRQIFLARDENFLVLGEALSGDGFVGKKIRSGKLKWRSELPISGEIKARKTKDAQEIFLSRPQGAVGTALPLALPEWRKQLNDGNDFDVCDNQLVANYSVSESALYAPIFVDLEPQRMHSALTWRRLSVGENLRNVSPAVAAGFRVQIDDQQWVLYRSLTECCNRSTLGLNLNSETYIGVFKPDGNFTAVLDVENSSPEE